MARTSVTKYALLGFLASAPASGYDLKRFIDGSIRYFWSESYGSIYPMLMRLEEEGLALSRRSRSGARPERKVFSITREGRAALSGWLASPCGGQTCRSELLLRLFFARNMPPAEAVRLVEREKERQLRLLEEYSKVEARINKSPSRDSMFWGLTLDYGRRSSGMALQWCDGVLAALKRNKGGRK